MSVPSLPMFLAETRFRFHDVAQKNCGASSREKSTLCAVPSDMSVDTSRRKLNRRSRLETRHEASTAKEEVLVHGSKGHGHKHHHRHHKPHHKETSSTRQVATMSANHDTQVEVVQAEKEDLVPLSTQELHSHPVHFSQSSLDSGFQHTPSDETVHRKDEHIKILQAKLSALAKKYKDLEKEKGSLTAQLANLHQKQEVWSCEKEKVTTLETQNRELKGDVVILKNLVYRLNVELERYQQKYKSDGASFMKPADVNEKGADILWSKINKNTLVPLLDAYSETIKEKDDLIHSYEVDLNRFVSNCKNIVEENEKLHTEVEELRKKQENMLLETQAAQQGAALAQEQSEVLTDQLQLQRNKLQEISSSCQVKISELVTENDALKDKYHCCRGDLLAAQGQLSVLREEYDNLKKDVENKIPFSVHTAAVSECRRLLEELKLKYETERSQLSGQLAALQSDHTELQTQHASLKAESKQEHIQVPNLERKLKKSQQQCEDLQRRMMSAQVSRDSTKRQLQKAMLFAEELVAEQERLLSQLHAKQQETKNITNYSNTINSRMNTLRSKIKVVKKVAFQDLHVIEKRIREQESSVERMKDEYHSEVAQLRNLVRHKEAIIRRLQQEKCKTEEELEVVWRAATSEDAGIKDKLKRVHILLPERDPNTFRNISRKLK